VSFADLPNTPMSAKRTRRTAALLPCVCGPNGNCPATCPQRPRKRRGNPEALIQKAIIDRLRWAGILAVHIPNEGRRDPRTGQRLKGEGMRPGFPDLACYQHGRHALLEVKAPRGRTSDAQIEMHAELARHAFTVAIVTSQDEAVEALRERGFRL
jgi:hypothetical protein